MNDLLNLSEDNTVGVLFENKDGELKLSVYDFDKNVTVVLSKEQYEKIKSYAE